MIARMRWTLALLSCLALANWAWADSELDGGPAAAGAYDAYNASDEAQDTPLASVTTPSAPTGGNPFLLASADQPLADVPLADDAAASQPLAQKGFCSGGDWRSRLCACGQPQVWYVSVGAVVLQRSNPTAGTIIGGQPGGSPAFNRGSDFHFGWNVGPAVTIARRIGSDGFLEMRYFNSYGTANSQFTTPGNFIGAGYTGPGGIAIAGHDLTKLNSTEFNWRRQRWNRLALLAGFRWIELRDDLSYQVGPTAASNYDFHNHLYGGQLGADWAVTSRSNPLQLTITGKAGIFGNANDGGVSLTNGGAPIVNYSGRAATTAFVGDLNFSAAYIVNNHLAIRSGYQLLWLSDLALASDAANRSLLNPSVLRTVSNDGNLFYQGATFALDFTW